jgi:hypothetical protein
VAFLAKTLGPSIIMYQKFLSTAMPNRKNTKDESYQLNVTSYVSSILCCCYTGTSVVHKLYLSYIQYILSFHLHVSKSKYNICNLNKVRYITGFV